MGEHWSVFQWLVLGGLLAVFFAVVYFYVSVNAAFQSNVNELEELKRANAEQIEGFATGLKDLLGSLRKEIEKDLNPINQHSIMLVEQSKEYSKALAVFNGVESAVERYIGKIEVLKQYSNLETRYSNCVNANNKLEIKIKKLQSVITRYQKKVSRLKGVEDDRL